MDLKHGRRDIKFSSEEEDQEEDTKNNFLGPPSSSSSSSNHGGGFRWGGTRTPQPEADTDEPAAPPQPSVETREHMFDKVVTPSDVGKLNRLVLPKQHAEKYFPLDSVANQKGLLLNFEDRTGKPWRFRYSYWNSSQSYVMTKGWSRFVKEKRLDAGDIVSFGRGVGEGEKERLFIDWKHRPEALIDHGPRGLPRLPLPSGVGGHHQSYPLVSFNHSPFHPCGSRLFAPPVTAGYEHHRSYGCSSSIPGSGGGQFLYFPSNTVLPHLNQHHSGAPDGKASMQMVLDSVPVAHNIQAAAKRVRLFGVNLDCAPELNGGDSYNGSTVPPPQRASQMQDMSSISHLQLRLGGDGTSLSESHPDEQQSSSHLDLDL